MCHLHQPRAAIVAAVTLAFINFSAVSARAEVTYTEFPDEELTVVRMTVTPAAEPVPVFKYRLQPRDIDMQPGNAAPFYYRALAELTPNLDRLRRKYSEDEELYPWYGTGPEALPIASLPLEKVRDAVQIAIGGVVEEQLKLAVARRDCNWDFGLDEIRGVDLIAVPLDEFQRSREASRMLALSARLAIAEHRYGDAIDTMRMNYRLAQHFASAPFLVSGLIGIAEAGITNGTVMDLIGAPDSPNLYWALAALPQPIVDLRPAARFEMEFGLRMFPFIHNAESTQRSPDEWNRLFTQAVKELSALGEGTMPKFDDAGSGIAATAFALAGYSHAKATLIADGMDPPRVEQMSVGQVLAIYTERIYQLFADKMETAWYVPYPDFRKFDRRVDDRLRAARPFGSSPNREVLPIVSYLLPAVQAARTAQVRLERDMAALQIIEALRLYAADNNGRLPESLNAVTQVPIPPNPATGKPFVYRLADNTAILELPKSDRIPGQNRRFEIKIATD